MSFDCWKIEIDNFCWNHKQKIKLEFYIMLTLIQLNGVDLAKNSILVSIVYLVNILHYDIKRTL